jgi:hypothetical protein
MRLPRCPQVRVNAYSVCQRIFARVVEPAVSTPLSASFARRHQPLFDAQPARCAPR